MVIKKKKRYRKRSKKGTWHWVQPHKQKYHHTNKFPKRGTYIGSRQRGGTNKTFWTKQNGKFTGRIPVNGNKKIGDATGIKNTSKRRILGRLDSPHQGKTAEIWNRLYADTYGTYPPRQSYRKKI